MFPNSSFFFCNQKKFFFFATEVRTVPSFHVNRIRINTEGLLYVVTTLGFLDLNPVDISNQTTVVGKGDCPVHCRMFNSILASSSGTLPHLSPVGTTKNAPRHCQISSGVRKGEEITLG